MHAAATARRARTRLTGLKPARSATPGITSLRVASLIALLAQWVDLCPAQAVLFWNALHALLVGSRPRWLSKTAGAVFLANISSATPAQSARVVNSVVGSRPANADRARKANTTLRMDERSAKPAFLGCISQRAKCAAHVQPISSAKQPAECAKPVRKATTKRSRARVSAAESASVFLVHT